MALEMVHPPLANLPPPVRPPLVENLAALRAGGDLVVDPREPVSSTLTGEEVHEHEEGTGCADYDDE